MRASRLVSLIPLLPSTCSLHLSAGSAGPPVFAPRHGGSEIILSIGTNYLSKNLDETLHLQTGVRRQDGVRQFLQSKQLGFITIPSRYRYT
ncbi:MAG: hypothetical protein RL077_6120 [Verrucomicrobiota bacterium]|jgi:hypothetical protein